MTRRTIRPESFPSLARRGALGLFALDPGGAFRLISRRFLWGKIYYNRFDGSGF
jgi:hypothetical protein